MAPSEEYCKTLREDPALRDFLYELYSQNPRNSAKQRRSLFKGATAAQLNFTALTLFFVFSKDIKIEATKHAPFICKGGKLKYVLSHFGSKQALNTFLRSSKANREGILSNINCYHSLLYYLFNRKKKREHK